MGYAVSLPARSNPYCGFKDDRERRNALIARDVRLVLIAGMSTFVGTSTLWKEVLVWLKTLVL